MDSVASLQREIARSVFDELKLELSETRKERIERGGTKNSEAYNEYLRGRFHWNRRTQRDIVRSVEFF
jgi:hypothetical protein